MCIYLVFLVGWGIVFNTVMTYIKLVCTCIGTQVRRDWIKEKWATTDESRLQSCAKNMGKLHRIRNSCHYKQNMNGTHNEQLQYNCLQQLSILRLKTYLDERN